MKKSELMEIRHDTPCTYENKPAMLQVSNGSIYLLTNDIKHDGSKSDHYHKYRDKFMYSWWLCDLDGEDNFDSLFDIICQNLVLQSQNIGRL